MSKKVVPDGHPFKGPFASPWDDPEDDFAQHDRWHALALEQVAIQAGTGTKMFGPLVPKGTNHYGALQLRCGEPGCGAALGGVYVTDGPSWQDRPFTYAEVIRVSDPKGRPATGKRLRLILDSVTAGSAIRSDCPRHGPKSARVAAALSEIDRGLARLQRTGKGQKFPLR